MMPHAFSPPSPPPSPCPGAVLAHRLRSAILHDLGFTCRCLAGCERGGQGGPSSTTWASHAGAWLGVKEGAYKMWCGVCRVE